MFTARAKFVSRLPQVERNIRRGVEEAVGEEAQAIAADARQKVPVSNNNGPDHVHTRDTIAAFRNTRLTWIVGVGGAGIWIEYGTSRRAAFPFFRPAAEAARPRLIKRLRRMKVL